MIELIKKEISPFRSSEDKINHLRELLQIVCLKVIYDGGHFSNITFTGGTALRILYDLRRFSEDLDFFLTRKKGYDFKAVTGDIRRGFGLNGLEATLKTWGLGNVDNATIRFPGLIKEVGITGAPDRDLSIQFEVNLNTPAGGEVEKTLTSRLFMFNIAHFSLPSLFATKLHACFFRKYVKGRDFYDLLWYLGRKVKPNYVMLNNAIKQTERGFPKIDRHNLGRYLLERLDEIDLSHMKKDVEVFLEDKNELDLLERTVIYKTVIDAFGK